MHYTTFSAKIRNPSTTITLYALVESHDVVEGKRLLWLQYRDRHETARDPDYSLRIGVRASGGFGDRDQHGFANRHSAKDQDRSRICRFVLSTLREIFQA